MGGFKLNLEGVPMKTERISVLLFASAISIGFVFATLATTKSIAAALSPSQGLNTNNASKAKLGEIASSQQTLFSTQIYSAPQINVSPQSLSSVQEVNDSLTKTLTISNTGDADLSIKIGVDSGASFLAASTRLYGYAIQGAWLRVVGTEDGTRVQVIDLSDGSIIGENDDLDRYEIWDVYPGPWVSYKVESNHRVLGYESDFISMWGHTTFIPSLYSGPVGREFIFYYFRSETSRFYVFAMENATVKVYDTAENLVVSKTMAAGEYWELTLPNAVYHITSSGLIAMETVAGNGYSTVPAASGDGVGWRFYFATDGDFSGSFAVFAYQDSDVQVYDLDTGLPLYSQHVNQGQYWMQEGVGTRQLRLESTGMVEVWAGDNEDLGIDGLGDDISFAGGVSGREFYVHSLRDGSVFFAPFDNTEINVSGATYHLDQDDYFWLAGCCYLRHVQSSKPILIQTLGRDTSFNDVGTYLGGVLGAEGGSLAWLTAAPVAGTISSTASVSIDVTFDSTGLQPGDYAGQIGVQSNDLLRPLVSVPVTMTVLPTADMGRVTGSVSDAWTGKPLSATVELVGVHSLVADPNYTIWAPAGTYALTAYASGYVTATRSVAIPAGGVVIEDLALKPTQARTYLPCVFRDYCADFFDDFSDPSSGWFIGEDPFVRSEYLNGEYRVLSKSDQYYYVYGAPTCDRENYVVEVEARWAGTPGESYGIVFGITGDYDQYYDFEINTDYREYGLWRFDGNDWHTIVPITFSWAINGGTATNRLKVTRIGDQIRLEVNGVPLGTWIDGNITGISGVGIASSPYEGEPVSDARFDNFSVIKLNASALSMGNTAEIPAPAPNAGQPGSHRQSDPPEKDWLLP
jgi:hypothetical protein